jgi:hypothetical protein
MWTLEAVDHNIGSEKANMWTLCPAQPSEASTVVSTCARTNVKGSNSAQIAGRRPAPCPRPLLPLRPLGAKPVEIAGAERRSTARVSQEGADPSPDPGVGRSASARGDAAQPRSL